MNVTMHMNHAAENSVPGHERVVAGNHARLVVFNVAIVVDALKKVRIIPIEVVVAAHKLYMLAMDAAQKVEHLVLPALHRQVAQDAEGVALSHALVDVGDNAARHLVHRGKGALRKGQDVLMAKMQIAGKPKHGRSSR